MAGVQAAGAVSALPLSGQGSSGTTTIDTQSVPFEDTTPEADQRVVTADYFKAMGIALLRGRFFEARDSDTAPPVAIVDESLAQTYWPNQDPIGKRLHPGGRQSTTPWITIVGVVRHVSTIEPLRRAHASRSIGLKASARTEPWLWRFALLEAR